MVTPAGEEKDCDNSWENGMKAGQEVHIEIQARSDEGLGIQMNTRDGKEVK